MAQEKRSGSPSSTRNAILTAALALFSQNGFEGTSMRDIASEVGISQGAIYKHFKGKEDVLAAICEHMEKADGEHAQDADVPPENPEPTDTPCDLAAFRSFTLDMFSYWASDEVAAPFRRMLEIDRFRTPQMRELHAQYLGSGSLEYTSDCLASMGISESGARHRAMMLWGAFRLLLELVDAHEIPYERAAEELAQALDSVLV